MSDIKITVEVPIRRAEKVRRLLGPDYADVPLESVANAMSWSGVLADSNLPFISGWLADEAGVDLEEPCPH